MSTYNHLQNPKIGVLLVNTGTPAAPTKKALRPYLKQFLWDPRIVDTPRWLWWIILNGIILNTRPKKSARAYQRIWTERGSPLAMHTEDQALALGKYFKIEWGDTLVVDWAMRYGSPSIPERLDAMHQQGVEKLLVFPLFPQFASATTASISDAVADYYKTRMWLPEIRLINNYCDNEKYINALADSIESHWQANGKADKLIFSYHGEPLRYLHKGDPYHCQCLKTTRLVAEKLNLQQDQYLTSFQSRFGPGDWLKPYTDEVLKALPSQGVKKVQILCPGFSADCLETVDEIAIENKEYFMEAGGESFDYIPALNSNAKHINVLASIIDGQLSSWSTIKNQNRATTESLYQQSTFNKTGKL